MAWPSGTYFYHGHEAMDYADGIRGILIVEDDDPHYYDDAFREDHALLFSEWLHLAGEEEYTQHLAQGGAAQALTGGATEVSDREDVLEGVSVSVWWTAGLVNGFGVVGGLTEDEIILAEEVVGTPAGLAHFQIAQGSTARLRLVHGGWYYTYKFSIDDHAHIIVAESGSDVAPVPGPCGNSFLGAL